MSRLDDVSRRLDSLALAMRTPIIGRHLQGGSPPQPQPSPRVPSRPVPPSDDEDVPDDLFSFDLDLIKDLQAKLESPKRHLRMAERRSKEKSEAAVEDLIELLE